MCIVCIFHTAIFVVFLTGYFIYVANRGRAGGEKILTGVKCETFYGQISLQPYSILVESYKLIDQFITGLTGKVVCFSYEYSLFSYYNRLLLRFTPFCVSYCKQFLGSKIFKFCVVDHKRPFYLILFIECFFVLFLETVVYNHYSTWLLY